MLQQAGMLFSILPKVSELLLYILLYIYLNDEIIYLFK